MAQLLIWLSLIINNDVNIAEEDGKVYIKKKPTGTRGELKK